MKYQTTSTTLKKLFAGAFVLILLSVRSFAQPVSCNAHFYHQGHFNSSNIYFYATPNHNGTTYSWNFGDNDTSTQRSPVHAYAASGTYNVCLTVTRTDSAGAVICTDTDCDSVHFTLPPPPPPPVCNAHFSHHQSHNSSAIDFDVAHNPAGSTYSWDFGDTHTANVGDTDYTYAQVGTYYACLTVTKTDTAGNVLCTDTWCDSVYVGTPAPPPPPVCNAHYYHHRGCSQNAGVHFYAFHNSYGTTYAWNFGDGDTSTSSHPVHAYAQPGTYYACLTVTNTDTTGAVLCTDTYCDSIHILPPPPPCNSHFTANGYHQQFLGVHFSSGHNPSNVTYAWDFGDGSTSTDNDPNHTYAAVGTYYVCLTVTNTDTAGVLVCTATQCDSVRVYAQPGHSHGNGCHSGNSHWKLSSKGGAETVNGAEGIASADVYPNPVTENSVLHLENTSGNVTFKIFDNTGRMVSVKENLTNGDVEINRSELVSGLYFYQVNDTKGSVLSGKLIVQ